jgi:hypothetical protein
LNSNAPSVDFPVGRFFMGLRGVACLSALAACVYIIGFFAGDFESWRGVLLLLAWALASLLSILSVRKKQSKCWLSWDGNVWQVVPTQNPALDDGLDGVLSVHIDLQKALLVSVANLEGHRKWFWVTQVSFPDRWHGFRCAVYSRAE